MKQILMVGGTFDENGGHSSGIFAKIVDELSADAELREKFREMYSFNGGHIEELKDIYQGIEAEKPDVVIWFCDVPNEYEKLRDIKVISPKSLLIMSKRNNGEYSFADLVNRALMHKANLVVEFVPHDPLYEMKLFDPLGNVWYKGPDVALCVMVLSERVKSLISVTRQPTLAMDDRHKVPNDKEFFQVVREYGSVFHELMAPVKEMVRFLGNASFRCTYGFPSFKSTESDGLVFMSRRNIDKRAIGPEEFVATCLDDNGDVYYSGEHKPSVDTSIQLRLYGALPKIRYILHSHAYIEGAPITGNVIPCGGLEEVGEILEAIDKSGKERTEGFYAVNLRGHGSIVMSKDVEGLKGLSYVARSLPEYQWFEYMGENEMAGASGGDAAMNAGPEDMDRTLEEMEEKAIGEVEGAIDSCFAAK